MKEVVIDGRRIDTMQGVHEVLSAELGFGEYFGFHFLTLWVKKMPALKMILGA